ncbi:hypothetical protein K0H71_15085 [Bacillus sp. IITD106]|nr:hypothetical protein [Bacillus sp. IITD106]
MNLIELTVKNTDGKVLVNFDHVECITQNQDTTTIDFGGENYFEVKEYYEDIKRTLKFKFALKDSQESLRR